MAFYRESKSRSTLVEMFSGIGAEIGVQEGRFSKEILLNPKVTKLYMIDAWRHFTNYTDIANVSDSLHHMRMLSAAENTAEFKYRRCVVNDTSIEVAKMCNNSFFDFVYLDANHSYEGVLEDIIAWLPKVKVGGILCGDDYLTEVNQFADFGVKKAVDEIFGDRVKTIEVEGEMVQWLVHV